MNRKGLGKIVLFVSILVIIIIVGLVWFYTLKPSTNNGGSIKQIDNALEDCQSESSQDSIDYCFSVIANERNDASICDKMSSNLMTGLDRSRRDDCYWSVSVQTNDSSSCYKIINLKSKDSCFSAVARQTLNGALCGEMSTTVRMESTGISDRDYCYIDIAVATKNPSLCDKIITSDSNIFWNKQKCRDAAQ